jgi:hypothetical protein
VEVIEGVFGVQRASVGAVGDITAVAAVLVTGPLARARCSRAVEALSERATQFRLVLVLGVVSTGWLLSTTERV